MTERIPITRTVGEVLAIPDLPDSIRTALSIISSDRYVILVEQEDGSTRLATCESVPHVEVGLELPMARVIISGT